MNDIIYDFVMNQKISGVHVDFIYISFVILYIMLSFQSIMDWSSTHSKISPNNLWIL